MDATSIEKLTDEYKTLVAAGDEAGAAGFLDRVLKELPEDVRSEFMTEVLMTAVEDIVAERDAFVETVEKGIAAVKALDALEKEVLEEK